MTARVFLHGFTGSPRNFQSLIAACPLGDRTYAPALLGHDPEAPPASAAELPASGRFEAEVDRLAAEIEQRGLAPVHVIGYSLGARLALGLSVRHPTLIARATLVGVHPGLRTEDERQQRRASDAQWCQLLERDGLAAFVDAWEKQPLFASQERLPAAAREAQRRERLRHSQAGLRLSLLCTGLAEMPSYWPALRTIGVPIDLVTGELDTKFTALARAAQAELPAGALLEVPGAGHNVLLERPSAIAALIGTAA
jgi:2-succinyl-6-hydroxy-2,4-cyclohexadiene-1-carboxylate synthase